MLLSSPSWFHSFIKISLISVLNQCLLFDSNSGLELYLSIIRVHLTFDLLWLTRFALSHLQEGSSCLAYYLKKWVDSHTQNIYQQKWHLLMLSTSLFPCIGFYKMHSFLLASWNCILYSLVEKSVFIFTQLIGVLYLIIFIAGI